MPAVLDRGPLIPSDAEHEAMQRLEALLPATAVVRARLILGPKEEVIEVPGSLVEALRRAVHELVQGNAIVVAPVQHELTTQQAAELLNVSRPFLVKLLESGEIPFRNVGAHRRVGLRHLLEYREQRSQKRRKALAGMAYASQEMGLYE